MRWPRTTMNEKCSANCLSYIFVVDFMSEQRMLPTPPRMKTSRRSPVVEPALSAAEVSPADY